ncbi:hypothetical protein QYE76_067413 [Lolium multiflorum]|uniref:Uncharacterized protein n=1 Tax=Lolium multiflorum TaxID=4521 RepID=A0AAD8WAY0_LOLMU|nr:hypothetical protein QYE76_067413 [Lolium multiflorum]
MGFAAARLRKVFRIVALGRGFATEAICRRKGRSGGSRGPEAARPGPGRAACGHLVAPLRYLFGLLEAPCKNRTPGEDFVQFENISLLGFLKPKTAKTNWLFGILLIVDAVADFADQFTRLERENVQLRKAVKTTADQVLEANRLTTEAQNENTILKDELKKLKKKMKDEQKARHKAFIETDEKEGALREYCRYAYRSYNKLRVDTMSDPLSFATESSNQLQDLLKKTKGALSKLFSMMFTKMGQNKTLGEMADSFFVDSSEAIEVLKRRSRLYGAVLTFQLLMGHGLGSDLEKLSKALPMDADNCLVNLEPFKQSSVMCANRLLKLVEEDKNKTASQAAPGSSAQA